MDGSHHEPQIAPVLRSAVAWGLLGLLIERPSYGYELMQRFQRTYGETLALTSPAQIYTALTALKTRSLIHEMSPSKADASTRRPRPHYRATEQGVAAYQDWLLLQIEEERQRGRLFARQLAMLEPSAALAVLEEYERECLAEADQATPAETAREALAERLLEGEEQTSLEVRLAWIEYARNELNRLVSSDPGAPAEG